jgi:hypothetical protein
MPVRGAPNRGGWCVLTAVATANLTQLARFLISRGILPFPIFKIR